MQAWHKTKQMTRSEYLNLKVLIEEQIRYIKQSPCTQCLFVITYFTFSVGVYREIRNIPNA